MRTIETAARRRFFFTLMFAVNLFFKCIVLCSESTRPQIYLNYLARTSTMRQLKRLLQNRTLALRYDPKFNPNPEEVATR